MDLPVYKMILGEDDGINAIAFVANPAIQVEWIAFSEQVESKIKFTTISEDERIVFGALLIPDQKIYRNDQGREFYVTIDKEGIKDVRERFMRNKYTSNTNAEHTDILLKDVFMIETFITDTKKGIHAPDNFSELPEGTWFGMFKVDNDEVWHNYVKTGVFTGFSIEGKVKLQNIELSDQNMNGIIEKITALFNQYLGEHTEEKGNVKLAKATLADGTEITLTPSLEEGATVMVVTAEGEVPAPDGTHELSDGTMITTTAGVIVSIESKEGEEPEMDSALKEFLSQMSEQIKALAKEVDGSIVALTKENTKLKTDLEAITEKQNGIHQSMMEFMDQLKELPVGEPTKKVEESVVKMSKAEMLRQRAIEMGEILRTKK